jgi:hypothetical protein
MNRPFYVRIALWVLRRYEPDHVNDRAKLLGSMRDMADKLNRQKVEIKEWRERCFSAERVVGTKLRDAIRDACKEHNDTYGSMWINY